MYPFSDRPTIQRLAGEHHKLVSYMDYHEISLDDGYNLHSPYSRGETRNYAVVIDPSVFPNSIGHVSFWVRIGLLWMAAEVQVDVLGSWQWQEFGSVIGSFTLSYNDHPTPLSLDPKAVSRALSEIILPHLRHHCPDARLPEA